jgi:hypothetical protein
MKPPCRLAQRAISGSSQKDGAARRSAAAINPLIHATMTGRASTCGRAKRCGAVKANAAVTKMIVAVSLKCRLRSFAKSAKVTALAAAASTTGPLQPNIE